MSDIVSQFDNALSTQSGMSVRKSCTMSVLIITVLKHLSMMSALDNYNPSAGLLEAVDSKQIMFEIWILG